MSNRTYSRGLRESDHSSRSKTVFSPVGRSLAGSGSILLQHVSSRLTGSVSSSQICFFLPETHRGNFEVQERSDGLLVLLFDQGRSLIGGATFPLPVLVLFPESEPHYPNIISPYLQLY